MSLATDLLEHARMLATLDPRRPRQVNLRLAVSSAYYSLFHLLTSEATGLIVRDDLELAARINRTFGHAEMHKVSREFINGQFPKMLQPTSGVFVIPDALQRVATSFNVLQQARHTADYDLSRAFGREEAVKFVEEAETAFETWTRVRQTDEARLYLTCFLMWENWNKP